MAKNTAPKTTPPDDQEPPTIPLFSRVSPEVAEQVRELARGHRVKVAEYVRWLLEDAASGKYTPSHLK